MGAQLGSSLWGRLEEERAEGWMSSAETVSQVAGEGGAVSGKNPEEFVGRCRHRPRESPVSAPYYGRRRSEVTKLLKQDRGGGWGGAGGSRARFCPQVTRGAEWPSSLGKRGQRWSPEVDTPVNVGG